MAPTEDEIQDMRETLEFAERVRREWNVADPLRFQHAFEVIEARAREVLSKRPKVQPMGQSDSWHIMLSGQAICGFMPGTRPTNWPSGHYWVSIPEVVWDCGEATIPGHKKVRPCGECSSRAAALWPPMDPVSVSRGHCTLENCGYARHLDAIVDLLGMPRGGVSVLDYLRARNIWEDKCDEWTDAIKAAFPTRSGSHDEYAVAMRMVGNRHGKFELIALVNWLLSLLKRGERLPGAGELPPIHVPGAGRCGG